MENNLNIYKDINSCKDIIIENYFINSCKDIIIENYFVRYCPCSLKILIFRGFLKERNLLTEFSNTVIRE